MMRSLKYLGVVSLSALVHSYASTDSPQDTSGYLPNHNIDPNALANFTISWTNEYNTNESFFAKPLVYTPSSWPHELVVLASSMNIVRVVDGLNGSLVAQRSLDPPFSAVDTGNCPDIPYAVGIIGTPYIDTDADIVYFFAKGYQDGQAGPQGTINGQYKMYGLNLPDLTDAITPVELNGLVADNDNTRYFVAGTVLQRPGVAAIGDTVIAGFGGHCDNFNYSGMLVGVSKTSGVGVTAMQAMMASPGAPSPQPTDITVQNGGKAGIWQSGMAIATDPDNNRLFFSTGNGVSPGQNNGSVGNPVTGTTYLSTMEQAVANYAINASTGALAQQDWFEPAGYDSLNGGDLDIGSSGVSLLNASTFAGGGVVRVAVAGSKNGTVYVLDADNLGGFKQGSEDSDAILQSLQFSPLSFFNGIGSYPLEGGYIYLCPATGPLYAYSLEFDDSGRPQFSLAGQSSATFACVGSPTVTSLNGQPGTGVVWMADVNAGLVAYQAVPDGNVLQPIELGASTGRLMKFQRPVFGDGRVYVAVLNTVMAVGPS